MPEARQPTPSARFRPAHPLEPEPSRARPGDLGEVIQGPDGFFHPANEAEVIALVKAAAAKDAQVRVCGAAHSEPTVILSDGFGVESPRDTMDLLLDRMTGMHLEREAERVTVEGGCRFGFDPGDLTGRSTEGSGLNPFLEARGLALAIVGGVSHQTVAGFLATGSDGGSLRHGFSEQVEALRIIDGRGIPRDFLRGEPDFADALVSLGCLGVVVSVTLRVVPRFDVVGREETFSRTETPFDLFGEGDAGLAGYFQSHDYARVLWWPQPGVDRLVFWHGDICPQRGPKQAYEPLPVVAGSRFPAQAAAGLALRALGGSVGPLHLPDRIAAPLYRAFVPEGNSQSFRDAWHRLIPLDDPMDERMMPVRFTEAWIDIEDAPEALARLYNHFERGGRRATGSFVVEIYPAKASPATMSPGYGRESLRLNFFWLSSNREPPDTLFAPIWDLLADLSPRYHWGKLVPTRWRPPERPGFRTLRAQLDPDGRFLSAHWRWLLEDPKEGAPNATPKVEHRWAASRGPFFRLEPTTLDYCRAAHGCIRVGFQTRAEPERVFDLFHSRIPPEQWMGKILRAFVRRTPDDGGATVVQDEHFRGLSVRVRTVVVDPGRRWSASVDACNLPLAERMFQDVRLTPRAGGTSVSWEIYYDPLAPLAPFSPAVEPIFRAFFGHLCRRAKRYLDATSGGA